MKSKDLRNAFINYFTRRDHLSIPSSSLVPHNDPTLLFTNAGMNQFKNVFLGLEPAPHPRAVTVQKCVRAGGKHNDLENVGHTARHHTFFEMLGNFSFGDYFKKDAIHFAWEFLTQDLQLPKDRLHVTVFKDDDEAAEIWHRQEGVPRERISRFGEKDNFWRMGDTGPCGPCSEIFYDHGPQYGANEKVGSDGDRFVEIWNLVFMQFFEESPGKMTPLPKPSIDTGSGLERVLAALQGVINNYDTDLFAGMIQVATRLSGRDYVTDPLVLAAHPELSETTSALRVLADHARSAAFLIGDGVLPANEGRGYVLRRIMRRAIRYGRKLSETKSIYPEMVAQVIQEMTSAYPALGERRNLIAQTVRDEEGRFLSTLDQGTELLEAELAALAKRGQRILDGATAFKLYDTFGFPIDLTRLISQERGLSVDEKSFEEHLDQARAKARASWKGQGLSADQAHIAQLAQEIKSQDGATEFTGYDSISESAKVLALSDSHRRVQALNAGEAGLVILDHTPIYAESGGQVSDNGKIQGAKGTAEVVACHKHNEIFVHHVNVTEGTLVADEIVHVQIIESERRRTMIHHSATHLLHAALRRALGEHITQAGSLVEAERLRFDFTHNKPLAADEIAQIENLVNQQIALALPVVSQVMAHKEALASGAMALFGEKYGDQVRVIRMGENFSVELCGGTHVSNTAQIRLFKIVSEGGVSAGVRRIEALAGEAAFTYLDKNSRENLAARASAGLSTVWTHLLSEGSGEVVQWIENSKGQIKLLEKQIRTLQGQQVNIEDLIGKGQEFTNQGIAGRLIAALIAVEDRQVLSELGDRIRDKIQSGVVILVGQGGTSHPVLVTVSKNLTPTINAGQILKSLTKELGGRGGGRPDFAQGAVENLTHAQKAFAKAAQNLGV